MATKHLTKAEFLEKVANFETSPNKWAFLGDKPAVIDFYAEWCGPCKSLSPIMEEVSDEFEGKVDFYKVDTEAEQELAAAFNIRSIPSILFIPKEGDPQMAQGLMPKSSLKEAVNTVLLK